MAKSTIELLPPVGGLDRRHAYQRQPPFTTPDSLNARPDDAREQRLRVGSRPGLGKRFVESIADEVAPTGEFGIPEGTDGAGVIDPQADPGAAAGDDPVIIGAVNMLAPMQFVSGNGIKQWVDTFNQLSLSNVWSDGLINSGFENIDKIELDGGLLIVDDPFPGAQYLPGQAPGAVRDALPIDAARTHTVEMVMIPFVFEDEVIPGGEQPPFIPFPGIPFHLGKYSIFMLMGDVDPESTSSLEIRFEQTYISDGSGTTIKATVYKWEGGTPTWLADRELDPGETDGGWATAILNPAPDPDENIAHTLLVYWNREVMSAPGANDQTVIGIPSITGSGSRIGFKVDPKPGPNVPGQGAGNLLHGRAQLERIRVRYFEDQVTVDGLNRTVLVAAAAGFLNKTEPDGTMQRIESDVFVNPFVALQAKDRLQKLYIGDHSIPYLQRDDVPLQQENSVFFLPDLDPDLAAFINAAAKSLVVRVFNVQPEEATGTYRVVEYDAENGFLIVIPPWPAAGEAQDASIEIVLGTKVYDAQTDTVDLWMTEEYENEDGLPNGIPKGHVPTQCIALARYRDRILLGGPPYAPNLVFASRQGNPNDFDVSRAVPGQFFDPGSAFASTSFEGGVIGEPVTAIMPHGDDYCLIGGLTSLSIWRGDPIAGGTAGILSRTIGVISPMAWCSGPAGETIFLSRQGLYMVPAGGNAPPAPMSINRIPQELVDVDARATRVQMAYDVQFRGIHIFLTTNDGDEARHWWFAWDTQSFWPVGLNQSHEPRSLVLYQADDPEESGVMVGCRDGFIRHFEKIKAKDDGIPFQSFVDIGPISLGGEPYAEGIVNTMDGVGSEGSGLMVWTLRAGKTSESAFKSEPRDFGFWRSGLNHTVRPRRRGVSAYLRVGAFPSPVPFLPGLPWSIETITVNRKSMGRVRVS